MHYAAMNGKVDALRCLVELGANLEAKDNDGEELGELGRRAGASAANRKSVCVSNAVQFERVHVFESFRACSQLCCGFLLLHPLNFPEESVQGASLTG